MAPRPNPWLELKRCSTGLVDPFPRTVPDRYDREGPGRAAFTSTEVVYGVTGAGVTELPEYGVSP